jgi:hypothetical protein
MEDEPSKPLESFFESFYSFFILLGPYIGISAAYERMRQSFVRAHTYILAVIFGIVVALG